MSQRTRESVRGKLWTRSEGTYLWVGFDIKALKKVRVIDMEKTVDSFPQGLDATYRRIFFAILTSERERVIDILCCVITASAPLTLIELATAVQTNPATGQTLKEAIVDEMRSLMPEIFSPL
jgi:hypothetical protein